MGKPKKQNKESIGFRKRFTQEEDEQILKLIKELGQNQWEIIAKCLKDRTPRQCRERWLYYINPDLNRSPWTPEEDELLIQLAQKYGTKWTALTQYFDNRPSNSLKNRFYVLNYQRSKPVVNISTQYQMTPEKHNMRYCEDAPTEYIPNAEMFSRNDCKKNYYHYLNESQPFVINAGTFPYVPVPVQTPDLVTQGRFYRGAVMLNDSHSNLNTINTAPSPTNEVTNPQTCHEIRRPPVDLSIRSLLVD